MPNMSQVIAKHNLKVAKENEPQQAQPGCNCRGGAARCPVDGACQSKEVVYQAKVTREDNNKEEYYTGLTARPFKVRYYEHRSDFNNEEREGTCLSNYIWELKKKNVPYRITWKILGRSRSFNPSTKACNLCLKEKYFIMFRPEGATLNCRNEFFATCRHRLKPLLANS